jgi:cytochrome c
MRSLGLTVLACVALSACEEPAPPFKPPEGDLGAMRVERGRLLLAQYQCGSCHVIPDVSAARGTAGPPLSGFGRRSYIAGEVPNRPDTLSRWIMAPASLSPGTTMPSMGVNALDAQDMAAFLHNLR